MSTTATLNLLLFLIFIGLFVAVFARPPGTSREASIGGRITSFLVGLISSVLGYVLTGLDDWADFHLSVFVALGITIATALLIAYSDRSAGFWRVALSGYLGVVGPVVVGYALLALLCASAGGCRTS